ncbi:MAG TPA: glycoside hydrolase family 43 protein [Planctomycetota bacterium]
MPRYLPLCLTLLAVHCASAAENVPAKDTLIFTSFRGNGEDGLHLAYSRDGYAWTALKKDQSFLKPTVGGKLMRDPCIMAGPDGTFHLVWTTGWRGEGGFGYASSKDLITWSEQRFIRAEQPGGKNTWAPELFYDAKKQQFLIFWATTIPGAFPETDKGGDMNHRIYYMTTKDFAEFSQPKLLFNPGCNCIDATIRQVAGKYVMFFKDERPGKKTLRMATAADVEGPYENITEPFTGDWVEGPSTIDIGGEIYVYFDHYAKPHYYGAVKSADLQKWEDVSKKMSFPKDFRHGTVLRVSEGVLGKLMEQ